MIKFLNVARKKIEALFRFGKRRAKQHDEQESTDTGSDSPMENSGLTKAGKDDPGRPKRRKTGQSGRNAPAAGEAQREKKSPRQPWTIDDFQVVPLPGKSRFHDFPIPAEIMRAIAAMEFQYCTPVQEKSLEAVLSGCDLVGKANTGTGKTAVFLIAILSRILVARKEQREEGSIHKKSGVQALILAPTRELVSQIAQDALRLAMFCDVRIAAVYGGVDYQKQIDLLQKDCSDIVIATPGRLLDFIGKRLIDLKTCRMLVLDEADRMLDMGFVPDVRRIVGNLPEAGKRQTMLFSATVPEDVQRLAYQWCVKPQVVEAESEQVAVDTIEQVVYLATVDEKYRILVNLLHLHPDERIVVFANMKNETKRLAERLQRDGIDCVLLSGDVAQNKRASRLEMFRAGRRMVLVATDVAGRGLHIDDVTMVINYTLPYEPEDYVHRIGRTGRAGASGKAISFACEEGSFYLPSIEEFVGRKLECVLPEENLLAAVERRPARPHAEATATTGTGHGNSRNRSRRRRRPANRTGEEQKPKETKTES